MGSSGVRGPVWTSEDQSEMKKLSHHLTLFILRGAVRSCLTTLIAPLWLWSFPGLTSHSVMTPDTQAHTLVTRDLKSLLHKFKCM